MLKSTLQTLADALRWLEQKIRRRYNRNRTGIPHYIRETLRLVEEQANSLETRPPDECRQLAAAGLMRCCELLRGIRVLEDASLDLPAGILHRQHWETWLVSLSFLLRCEETLREIGGDYVMRTCLLNEKLNLGSEHVPDREEGAKKLNYYQIAKKVGPLLVEAGEAGDVDATVMGYNATYRVQSQFAVHVGLSTLRPYIHMGDGSWSIEPNPPAPFDDNSQFAALYTLHLAKYVFGRFDIATDAVEAAMDELHQLVRSEGAPSQPE